MVWLYGMLAGTIKFRTQYSQRQRYNIMFNERPVQKKTVTLCVLYTSKDSHRSKVFIVRHQVLLCVFVLSELFTHIMMMVMLLLFIGWCIYGRREGVGWRHLKRRGWYYYLCTSAATTVRGWRRAKLMRGRGWRELLHRGEVIVDWRLTRGGEFGRLLHHHWWRYLLQKTNKLLAINKYNPV